MSSYKSEPKIMTVIGKVYSSRIASEVGASEGTSVVEARIVVACGVGASLEASLVKASASNT